MINKIAAFLSPYLSEEMAIKGLKKITPKMGKYFAGATAAGYSTKQALDFLRQNSAGKECKTRWIDGDAKNTTTG